MRVVSDTSPICNLAVIERLELLKDRYKAIYIPRAVLNELSEIRHEEARERIQRAVAKSWIKVQDIESSLHRVFPLHSGEAAAINLAIYLKAELILIDEKKGRAAARAEGLRVSGVLGELLQAKAAGSLSLLRPEILRLRHEAGFFIDAGIEELILTEAGE
jgi:predicted nucleic acid-binding protein